jgi:hypothetical protein
LLREAKFEEEIVADAQALAKAVRQERLAKYDESEGQLEYMTWASDTQTKPSHHGNHGVGKQDAAQLAMRNAPLRSTASSAPAWLNAQRSASVSRYEPPKLRFDPGRLDDRRADGRVNLKGVRSNSHAALYERDFQHHTMRSFEARKAFKLKLLRDAASPATKTWGAVNSWYSSTKAWDDFMPLAKEGKVFREDRNQNIGGQVQKQEFL